MFKGNYKPLLRIYKSREEVTPESSGTADEFSWKVNEGEIYSDNIVDSVSKAKTLQQALEQTQHAHSSNMSLNRPLQENGPAHCYGHYVHYELILPID